MTFGRSWKINSIPGAKILLLRAQIIGKIPPYVTVHLMTSLTLGPSSISVVLSLAMRPPRIKVAEFYKIKIMSPS